MKRIFVLKALGGAAALFALVQIVPIGRTHGNPAAQGEPAWDSTETEALARRACFDCHSNETRWPWYSSIAPVSWLIQNHVSEGREHLNFSTWPAGGEEPEEAGEESRKALNRSKMPPWDYVLMHPEARLTQAERDTLAKGLEATLNVFGIRESGDREGSRRERGGGERKSRP